MRKIIDIIAGVKIDLLPHGIDLTKHEIKRLWTVYDLQRLYTWKKFDEHTGKKLEIPTSLEDVELRHLEGVFLEDRIHDWNIRPGYLLDYYSRVTAQGKPVQILIEYEEKTEIKG